MTGQLPHYSESHGRLVYTLQYVLPGAPGSQDMLRNYVGESYLNLKISLHRVTHVKSNEIEVVGSKES